MRSPQKIRAAIHATSQMRTISLIAISMASLLLFTACLQDPAKKETLASTASWFEGVQTAKNLGGYPASVKLTWNSASRAVTAYRIYSLEYDGTTKNNKWTQIDEVSGDAKSYINSDLAAGQIYSYMVRAVDSSDAEDGNTKQVSTVAFDGIGTARTTGKTTAVVTLNTSTGSFDEVRVYAQPVAAGSVKTLVATAKGSLSAINVTGLHSGVKYKFSVAAYMSYLGAEDGNEVYAEAQTYSDSFGSGATSDTDFAYRGVMNVQAYGDSPNAPVPPTARTIKLTWPAFSGATSTTKYRVLRAAVGYTMTASTATTCTLSTSVACIVNCTNTGAGVQTCSDTALAPAPMTYNYLITLAKTDATTGETWAEEIPASGASDFYVKVAVPPANMVLVQRDAANYDMCRMLGTAQDPRKKQRCLYSGIGASPYNSGPGKPSLSFDSGYYDFGYNLFVDRFRLACNWTRVSASCGPNGCIGITGSAAGWAPPSNTLGDVGNVYFALSPGYPPNCYYKTAGGWTTINNVTDPATIRAITTVDPAAGGTKHQPVVNYMNHSQAYGMCNAQTSEYGSKRLLRRREYVHATAFPVMAGEPDAVTDPIELFALRTGSYNAALNVGGQLPGYQRCPSLLTSYQLPTPTDLAGLLATSNTRAQVSSAWAPGILNTMTSPYFIGTSSTAKCVSRWGAQDVTSPSQYDTNNIVLADALARTNAVALPTATFAFVQSDYDSGVAYDWGTYALDGATGPSISGNVYYNTTSISSLPRFILPMGMPLITPNSIYRLLSDLIFNGTLGSNGFSGGTNNAALFVQTDTASTRYFMMEGPSQHSFSATINLDGVNARIKTWCALEAE